VPWKHAFFYGNGGAKSNPIAEGIRVALGHRIYKAAIDWEMREAERPYEANL
jgi:hypothetical protein